MRANLRAIAQAASTDPRKALLDSAGPLTDYEVFHNLVLVATYIAPPMLMQGPDGKQIEFHRTDRSLSEDRFQGKVGLVLKIGPLAFKDDAVARFGDVTIGCGDWVMYRPSDGMEMFIKDHTGDRNDGLSCRLIEDTLIKCRVRDPSRIY
jgi:hypothetical protein